ncbi:hypothetical protein ACWCQW_37155 [Streptomyces mirabilis]
MRKLFVAVAAAAVLTGGAAVAGSVGAVSHTPSAASVSGNHSDHQVLALRTPREP